MIRRGPRPDHFTVLANDTLRDARLSWKARGLLVFLLSQPDDWRVSYRTLAHMGPDGESATRSALKELEDHHYLERERIQDEHGLWHTESVIFDQPTGRRKPPLGGAEIAVPSGGNPGRDNRRSDLTLSTKSGSKEPRGTTRKPDLVWEALLESCAVETSSLTKTGRGAANRAVKALKDVGATPEEIHARACHFREHWPGVTLTPSALAKQWAQCANPPRSVAARSGPAADSYAARQRFLEGGHDGSQASDGDRALDAGELGPRPGGRGNLRAVE